MFYVIVYKEQPEACALKSSAEGENGDDDIVEENECNEGIEVGFEITRIRELLRNEFGLTKVGIEPMITEIKQAAKCDADDETDSHISQIMNA